MFSFCFTLFLLLNHACALYATENSIWSRHKFSPGASQGFHAQEQELTQKYCLDFNKSTKKNGIKIPFQSGFRASYYSPENFDFYVGFTKPSGKKTDPKNQRDILASPDSINAAPTTTLLESLTSGRWAHHFAFGVTMTF